jgi:hypothetical protein
MLAIADAYKIDRRQAAWAWILQSAPDVAIYLVSHETVASEPMLQNHFSDQYREQVRAQVDSDIVGGPSPEGPDFDHVGYRLVGPRAPQERDSHSTLAPRLEPDAVDEKPRRKWPTGNWCPPNRREKREVFNSMLTTTITYKVGILTPYRPRQPGFE